MDLQSIQTALVVGPVHNDPAVKPAGPQQGLIQNFGAVCGSQTHNALGGLEAVDLAEQLVQCLLLLRVVAVAVVTGTAHGVDLINKNDAGGDLRRLLEQVTDAACAHAHKHLHKIRAGNGEERHIRLPRHSLGKQGLAGTGRANQQGAFGQPRADLRVFLGIVEEVDDLLQRFLCLVLTGHILKGNAGLLFHVNLGLALAETAHHAVAAHALGNGAHEYEQQREGDTVVQDGQDQGVVFLDLPIRCHPLGDQFVIHAQPIAAGHAGITGLLLGGRLGSLFLGQIIDSAAPPLNLRQLVVLHGGVEVRVGRFRILAVRNQIVDPAEQ